jgi:hypothetical protein
VVVEAHVVVEEPPVVVESPAPELVLDEEHELESELVEEELAEPTHELESELAEPAHELESELAGPTHELESELVEEELEHDLEPELAEPPLLEESDSLGGEPSLLGDSTDSPVIVDPTDTKNESDDEDVEAALTTRPDNTLSMSLQALLDAQDDDDDEDLSDLPPEVSRGLPVEELDL